jgi:hypothetical protein
MRKTNIDRAPGTTAPKKGSVYTTAQRHAGRAAKQIACDKVAVRAREEIFAELLPFMSALKKGKS